MNRSTRTKIILVDDHPLVREWLTNLIHQQPDMVVCGEAETAPLALQLIDAKKPEVAIVDISLKDSSGLELIKDIKASHPRVAVIVLSMHDERLYAERSLRAGARGYIMKRETTRKVIAAIRTVQDGGLYVSEACAAAMAQKMIAGVPLDGSPVDLLSDRELEVFQLIGQGHGTRHIASTLCVNFKTVQSYCARIKEKLGLASATELLREAVRWEERKHALPSADRPA